MNPHRAARRLRRRAMAHRRPLAAVLVALAVALGLGALAPPEGPAVAVVVAARDLGVGVALAADDVTVRSVPAGLVPDGALPPGDGLVGRVLAGPVRRGETLTDARLVGPSLLALSGLGRDAVATPVRLADAGAAALLRPGDRVDVYAVPSDSGFPGVDAPPEPGAATSPDGGARATGPPPPGAARLVATDLLVLTVPATEAAATGADGALVVFAATSDVARALAHAAATSVLSVALRGPA